MIYFSLICISLALCLASFKLYKLSMKYENVRSELTKLELEKNEFRKQIADINHYKSFAISVNTYIGNYPAWKAQSEYREGMLNLGFPLSGNYPKGENGQWPSNLENVDIYLGKIVDSFSILLKQVGHQDFFGSSELWKSKEQLDIACGNDWLENGRF